MRSEFAPLLSLSVRLARDLANSALVLQMSHICEYLYGKQMVV